MEQAKIFQKGWRFSVETSLIKETKNYRIYDVKVVYMEYGNNHPVIKSYENLQDEFDVTENWFIKVKKTWKEEKDWEQIYNHFKNRFKEQEIVFYRF